MASETILRAETLLAEGDAAQGARLLAAAAPGDCDAAFTLALWTLAGAGRPRDPGEARALLRQAREDGHVEAARAEIALMANGSGAEPDWRGALRVLGAIAPHDERARQEQALIAAMALADDGSPPAAPRPERIGRSPDVWRVRGFLSPQECAHVAQAVTDILEPSSVVDPRTGRTIADPIRSSASAAIGPTRETLVVAAINRRIAAATGTDWRCGEPLTVLHYRPGQQYRPHLDVLPQAGNQRVVTMLLYLNQGYRGGETRFEASGLTIAGAGGDAIFFANVTPESAPDPLSRHAGLPVLEGTKWLATRWIRARPYSLWGD